MEQQTAPAPRALSLITRPVALPQLFPPCSHVEEEKKKEIYLIADRVSTSFIWIIPVVSQDVDCFYSVGLGFSWTFVVIIFNDQHGSTLFVSMYVSFA